jgi:hypothetical protein
VVLSDLNQCRFHNLNSNFLKIAQTCRRRSAYAGARWRLVLTALLFAAPRPLVAEPVDLLLVLAADASLSVDQQSYGLQREGYAIAFTIPRVLNAIRSGPTGRIAVLYLECAGANEQNVIIDWFLIDSSKTAKQFSNKLMQVPRLSVGRTSIGNAIDFAAAQFARAPYRAQHRIIDVSGNGINNAGRDPILARDEALPRDITINALVILNGPVLARNPGHSIRPMGWPNTIATMSWVGRGPSCWRRTILDRLVRPFSRN